MLDQTVVVGKPAEKSGFAPTHRWILLLLIGAGLLPLLLSASFWTHIPTRDSGVFLYMGSRILHGEVPYRDVWDHKGPLIFFLNALGLVLGGGSQWGVRLLEWIATSVAALLGYLAMRRVYGRSAALYGSFAWLFTLPIMLDGGNFTEEFALPLQFGAVWLLVSGSRDDVWRIRWFGIGVLGGTAFLLRQNLIGIWVALIIALAVQALAHRRLTTLFGRLSAFLPGFALPMVIVVLYFGQQDALSAFWEDYFLYNFAYASASFNARIAALLGGIEITSVTGLFLAGLAGWLWLIASKTRSGIRLEKTDSLDSEYVGLVVLALPIEMLFASLSGNLFAHYFMAWLPVLALLAGYFFSRVPSESNKFHSSLLTPRTLLIAILVGVCVGYTAYSFRNILAQAAMPNVIQQTAQVVSAETEETDPVLIWGASASVNYLANRRSPTRYVYQLPLFNPAYANSEMVDRFLQDLTGNPPRVIVDSSEDLRNLPETMPSIAYLTSNQGKPNEQAYVPDGMDRVVSFISSHYCFSSEIGMVKWSLYKLCR